MANDRAVALVTGGGARIGKACERRFVQEGYRVMIGDMSAEDGEAMCEALKTEGGELRFLGGNVANESDVMAWAREASEVWGRIDALVANAGARVRGSILDATEEDWDLIVNVNLKGRHLLLQGRATVDDRTSFGIDRHYFFGQRESRTARNATLRRDQGGGRFAGAKSGCRPRLGRDPGERGVPGLHRDGFSRVQRGEARDFCRRIAGTKRRIWPPGTSRGTHPTGVCGLLPGERRCVEHHGAGLDGRWRAVGDDGVRMPRSQ